MGVALFLIFLGCEQDEVQQTDKKLPLQQEALDVFFKKYRKSKDEFKDKVVDRLLAINDSSAIVCSLASKYGQPEWNVEKTNTSKSETYLIVPVCIPGVDSVSAVFVFMEQDSTLHLKVFEANNPDTLISDFVLFYQCSLFPNKEYTTRKTVPMESGSKDIVERRCWYTYTSGNRVDWTLTNVSCTFKILYEPTLDIGMGDAGSPTGGTDNGGNSGSTGTTTSPTDCSRGMTIDELTEIRDARQNIESRGHCASNNILRATERMTYEVDPCMASGTYAEYTLVRGTIQFRNASEVNEARLYEETMHAYQDIFYQGLSKFGPGEAGYTNMEFEAKLMQAIYCIESGIISDVNLGNAFANEWMDFQSWILKYLKYGTTEDFWNGYKYFIELFEKKIPTYAKLQSDTFPKMSVINKLIEGCPKY